MTLLNNLHPNELFRFMQVRGPKRVPVDRVQTYFIHNVYDQISTNELPAIQRNTMMLYPMLAKRGGNPEHLREQMADVAAYQKSKQYISDPDDYALHYPVLTSILDWLDAHLSTRTREAVGHKIKAKTGQDVRSYVKSLEFKTSQYVFWDNLIANLLSPGNPLLITLACKYLAGLHLAEVIAHDLECEEGLPELTAVYHAKPLVPKWVFKILTSTVSNADEGVGDQPRAGNDDTEKLAARFKRLNQAIQEIRALITRREEAQQQEMRQGALSVTDVRRKEEESENERQKASSGVVSTALENSKGSYVFTPQEQSDLSEPTAQLVKELFPGGGTLHLDVLLNELMRQVAPVTAELGGIQREYAVRVGDAIIMRKELCVEPTAQDPCAIRLRKPFASRGSYMNTYLIGELLVTKQQLIKYDAGEVAHVEALMMGLEKERTHRRLNRTESTTTFERESINETEREQQTTERFSMEKETAKTLNQDFKISTGTNFTATYGAVTFGAQLDASFGVSQTQSQKTATSFSKEVTTRALSRVKETVRETQTVTIINEIEETSVNKLTNNTGDHVNGVYCWLDKFYLNKIINYGARMMLEFTVPEPANFYIFRKMTKPRTGAIVEQPTLPSEVVGPDGQRLTSPLVLDDVNFAFWAAQYGATNVDAPPQEYIKISRAFKSANEVNTDDPADVYTSFTGSIDIDKDYEAVLAYTNVEATSLGTSSFFTGFVATTSFSTGFTGNIGLPNIQRELAIAISSHMTNYVCSVWVSAKRSPEALNNWKLDAYGKIIEAYNRKKQAYDEWLNAQYADSTFGFTGGGSNPDINRATEREELKKRCLELFTGQRFESFDAATNGIQNVSGYPEIVFREAIAEGNIAKFFEQAFEWENITYIFYPYFWGRKETWPAIKNIEETSDPLFTKFLQAGYARVQVPVRPGFENYLLFFSLLANLISFFAGSWYFATSIFGALDLSNGFIPGINDPVYMSVTQELIAAQNLDDENGTIIGHYVQKVPTNLVYVVPLRDAAGNPILPGSPLPGLPDNSADPDIQPFL